MKEIIFEIREDEEVGYCARALGYAIFTQGDTVEEICHNVQEATDCFFDDGDPNRPGIIRLHFVRDEVLAA